MALSNITPDEIDVLRSLLSNKSLRDALFPGDLTTAARNQPNRVERIIETQSRPSKRLSSLNPSSPGPLSRESPKSNPQDGSRYWPRKSINESDTTRTRVNSRTYTVDNNRSSNAEIRRNFVIGIDYGTTFTSISYYVLPEGSEDSLVFPNQIRAIQKRPHDSLRGGSMQVPTESWYSITPRSREEPKGQFDDGYWDSDVDDDLDPEPIIPTQKSVLTTHSGLDHEESSQFLWGYKAPYEMYRGHSSRNRNRHIERAKLILLSSKHTAEDRKRLRPSIDRLIEKGIIRKFGKKHHSDTRDIQDIIADFLVAALTHTKEQLVRLEGFDASLCSISFVLAIPTIWPTKSTRILQYALEDAIRTTGFGKLTHGSIDNLFVVSEPEAAATYVVGNSRTMIAGETFVVMDCGGGTVDGSTYTVTEDYPLRLERELFRPGGDNCGASYLNENFRKLIMEKLADEDYLEDNGDTRESIVNGLVSNFEDFDKRTKDIYDSPSARFKIPGLLGDLRRNLGGPLKKGFEDNFLLLFPEDYEQIFLPLLKRTGAVLKTQLDAAITSGKSVKKVFLIGGFGAAPSLRTYLKKFLCNYVRERKLSFNIELVLSDEQTCVTAVSSGAVLRALNLENGPKRLPHSNYGFLRMQAFEPDRFAGHWEADTVFDEFDGQLYVAGIDYFMLKMPLWKDDEDFDSRQYNRLEQKRLIGAVHHYRPFTCRHHFPLDSSQFLCEEVLYVNDGNTKSNYPLNHPLNKHAQVAGKITTDMTFLKTSNSIAITYPIIDNEGDSIGEEHYEVEYDLIVIVEGRNLRYEARYPVGSAGRTLKAGQVSIASAFRPGTG